MFASFIMPDREVRGLCVSNLYLICRKSSSQIDADISFTKRAHSFPEERLLHDRRSGSYSSASINSVNIAE